MEGDCEIIWGYFSGSSFQSTPSAWRETLWNILHHTNYHISIHSLRMEGDAYDDAAIRGIMAFQSTPSAWRETISNAEIQDVFIRISIHSLRMEGDYHRLYPLSCCDISIHSLRMEGDYFKTAAKGGEKLFQSTPSAWRETPEERLILSYNRHFNPLPPHGGRQSAELP